MSSQPTETLRETMLRDEVLRLQSELDAERSSRRAESADMRDRLESALLRKDIADRLQRGIESLSPLKSSGLLSGLVSFFRRAR